MKKRVKIIRKGKVDSLKETNDIFPDNTKSKNSTLSFIPQRKKDKKKTDTKKMKITDLQKIDQKIKEEFEEKKTDTKKAKQEALEKVEQKLREEFTEGNNNSVDVESIEPKKKGKRKKTKKIFIKKIKKGKTPKSIINTIARKIFSDYTEKINSNENYKEYIQKMAAVRYTEKLVTKYISVNYKHSNFPPGYSEESFFDSLRVSLRKEFLKEILTIEGKI